ncbi:MAG: AsmA family protein [Alphaproteobacteria bacterium]
MKRPRRTRSRTIWRIVLAGLALLLVLPAGLLVYISLADMRPLAARLAGEALGREVEVGELRLDWGRTLKLELRDLRIGNADWSDQPDMIRIGRLTAVAYLPALLRGVVQYDVLRLEGVELTLERRDDGSRNWRFGETSAPSAAPAAGLALIPKSRRQFPDVKDLRLGDLLIVYRSEGRRDIRIAVEEATLGAPDGASPTRLAARGAYNDIPLSLTVNGGSYAEMRDAAAPFPAEIVATSDGTELVFRGGIAEPLDFDGVAGRLDLDIADFASFLKLFGYERPLGFPVALSSLFAHDGNRWALSETTGTFKDSQIAGRFVFREGGHGEPDDAEVDVTLDRFAVETLVAGIAEPDRAGGTPESFRPEDDPAVTLRARIAAGEVTYGGLAVQSFRLDGEMAPGALVLREAAFRFADGAATARGALRGDGLTEAAADIAADYAGGDVGRLAALAGLEAGQVSGRLDGRLTWRMKGETAAAALAAGEGSAVLAMRGGAMARSLLEKVSLDLRALFRRNEAMAEVSCLLAVADVGSGTARLLPLVLRSDAAHLTGGGALDIAGGQIDLLLRSDPGASGGLALDWPLHVTGTWDAPNVAPQPGSGPAWLGEPARLPPGLEAGGRDLARASGCVP